MPGGKCHIGSDGKTPPLGSKCCSNYGHVSTCMSTYKYNTYMYAHVHIHDSVMSLKRGRAALRRSMSARFKITSHFRALHSLEQQVLGLEVKVHVLT